MSRFDYVKYDSEAEEIQRIFKESMINLESDMNQLLVSIRPKYLALAKLEEVYMWIGKAIRDDQLARSGTAELLEERKDG
jgi:hypothetical protein